MRIKSSVIATSLPGNDHYRLSFKFQTKIKSSSAKRIGIKFVPAVSICRASVYSTRWTLRHEVHHMSEPLQVLISKLMVIAQVCRYCDFHFDPRVPPFSTRVCVCIHTLQNLTGIVDQMYWKTMCAFYCALLSRNVSASNNWNYALLIFWLDSSGDYFFKKNCYRRYSFFFFDKYFLSKYIANL